MSASRTTSTRRLLTLLGLSIGVVACGGEPLADSGMADAPLDTGAGAHVVTELMTSSFVEGTNSYPVSFVRVDRPDGGRTYVQFVASNRDGARGAVLMTLPYVVAPWTGEEVDQRWASYPIGDGLHEDVDGPDYDGARRAIFEHQSADEVSQQGLVHLLNGLSVAFVFGRFYAGGDVRDEVADMRAGAAYLATRDDVDFTRVGVYGGSWGGFESLQASAVAEPWRPAVTVAVYPVVDIPTWVEHIETRTGLARDLLRAHLARVVAGTTGGFAGLGVDDLCARLPTRTLILHDDHDNLAPIAAAQRLVDRCGVTLLRWPRVGAAPTDAASHGPILTEVPDVAVPSFYTYANAYLHATLVPEPEPLVGLVQEAALIAHLSLVVDAQRRGEDVRWILPRLRDLLRPSYLELPSSTVVEGRTLVARAVNAAWSTTLTPDDVEAALARGVPALP